MFFKRNLSIVVNFLSFIFFSTLSQASVIDLKAGYGNLIIGNESDKLLISGPQVNGFSQSSFNKLKLDKPLQIINAVSLNPNLAGKSEAITIVLELSPESSTSEDIELLSEINLIGKSADLIILSRGRDLKCDGCSFKGFSRVTISTGIYYDPIVLTDQPMQVEEDNLDLYLQLAIDNVLNNETPSTFTLLTQSGEIVITTNGLKAEGASFLDLLSQNIRQYGTIRTNLRGNANAQGGFQLDADGDKEIASGILQMHLGGTYFNYFNSSVYKQDNNISGYIGVNGDIQAGSVKVYNHSVLGGAAFTNASLSTKADYSMLNIYKGKNIVSDGAIYIDVLGEVGLQGSSIEFDRALNVSANALKVGSNSSIGNDFLGHVDISVVDLFLNYGEVGGSSFRASVGEFENEGVLRFEGDLYVKSENNILNTFGGAIEGENVLFEAGAKVLNGTYYPFRTKKRKFPYIVSATSIQPSVEPHLAGYYYENALDELPSNVPRYTAESLAATIVGENIELVSSEFINVNPYYRLNESYVSDAEGSLDPVLSDQVVISANNNLTIRTSNLYNVSAIVESVSGELALLANYVHNERYRVRVDTYPGNSLPNNFCSEFDACTNQSTDQSVVVDDNLLQYSQYYSPAGRLYSGDRALFNVGTKMVNELSFVEIYGDLDMNVNDFLQLGYAYHNVINFDIVTHYKKRVCKRKIFGKCISRKTVRWTSEEPHQNNFVIGQIPTLFSVAGFVTGIGEQDLISYTENYKQAHTSSGE